MDLNLFALLHVARESSNWAWLGASAGALVIGAGIAELYDEGAAAARAASALVAVLVILVGVPGIARLVHVVTESHGLVSIGPGLYLAGLSEIAVVVAVALPRKRNEGTREAMSPRDGPKSEMSAATRMGVAP